MLDTIKDYFTEVEDTVKTNDTKAMLKIAIPVAITVGVIAVFKIPVWKPAKKTFRRARSRYTRYRKGRR